MTEATVNLYKRITDDVWILSVKHGDMVDHVELYRFVGHPVTDEAQATEAAAQWLEKHGITSVTSSKLQQEQQAEQPQGDTAMAETATKQPRKRVQKKKTPNNTNGAPKRTMSVEHKAALAEGRNQARIVNAYLQALEAHRPKRGRQRTAESIQARLDKVETELSNGVGGVTLLSLVQERRDLTVELAAMLGNNGGPDISEAEGEFVKVAKAFSETKHISYGAWREVGVPADVLKAAGITRSKND